MGFFSFGEGVFFGFPLLFRLCHRGLALHPADGLLGACFSCQLPAWPRSCFSASRVLLRLGLLLGPDPTYGCYSDRGHEGPGHGARVFLRSTPTDLWQRMWIGPFSSSSCPLSPHRRRAAAPACRCHASSSSPRRAGSRLHRRRRLTSILTSVLTLSSAATSPRRRRRHFVVESPSSCRVIAPSSLPCFPRRRRPAA